MGLDANDITRIARNSGAANEDEIISWFSVYNFLVDNSELIAKPRGRGGKNYVCFMFDEGDVAMLAKRFFDGRRRKVEFKVPATVPDPAVATVLEAMGLLGYDDALTTHLHAMGAENVIGSLLELYIASEMEHYGWVWCSGEIVKAVDFIKWDANLGWVPIQIKNRSNSENSSSSAIRNGTQIKKWFRSFANKPATNWDKFPEPDLRGVLTEDGFTKFIKDYLGS